MYRKCKEILVMGEWRYPDAPATFRPYGTAWFGFEDIVSS